MLILELIGLLYLLKVTKERRLTIKPITIVLELTTFQKKLENTFVITTLEQLYLE